MPVPCWGYFTARERTYLCYHVLSPWSDQLFIFFFFFLISPEKTFSVLPVISFLMHIKPQVANLMCFPNFYTGVQLRLNFPSEFQPNGGKSSVPFLHMTY